MSAYDTTSTPIRPRHTGVCPSFEIQSRIRVRRSATYSLRHHGICFHPKLALHGTSSVTVRRYCEVEPAFFAIKSPSSCLVSIGFYLLLRALIRMCFPPFSTRRGL